jgi:hypothetical protein
VRIRESAKELLWVLVIIGYPAVALLGTWLNVDSTTASFPFRAVVLLLSVGLLTAGLISGRRLGAHPFLVVFFVLYMGRLLWDWLVVAVPGAEVALLFFVVVVALPTLALIQSGMPSSEMRLATWIMVIGAIVSIGSVVAHLYGGLEERALAGETGRLSYEALNPISMGHAAATTIIAACSLLYYRRTLRTLLVLAPIVAVAGACMFFAASRGPLAALIVALIVLAWASRKGPLLIALGIAAVIAVQGRVLESETEFAARLAGAGEDTTSVERLWLQASALSQFAGKPLLGSAHVELGSGTYPHNVFVETLMATGLIGSLPFLVALFRAMRGAKRGLREGHVLIAALFVQAFVGFQFSGAIWGSATFWITVGVLGTVKRGESRRTPGQANLRAPQPA